MNSGDHSQQVQANPPRVDFISFPTGRPQKDDGRRSVSHRIQQLLRAHRLSFTMTALALSVLLMAAAQPTQAQTALQRNTTSAQLHIQVYLVHPTLSQVPMQPAPANSGGVTFNIAPSVPQLRFDRTTAVAPLPAAPASAIAPKAPAVLETTSIVPR